MMLAGSKKLVVPARRGGGNESKASVKALCVERYGDYKERSVGALFMVRMTIEMPEEAMAALRKDPGSFAREMRLAAAVKWYEMKIVSQGRAAEIAGLSRREFLDALGRFGVTPFQYDADEIVLEIR